MPWRQIRERQRAHESRATSRHETGTTPVHGTGTTSAPTTGTGSVHGTRTTSILRTGTTSILGTKATAANETRTTAAEDHLLARRPRAGDPVTTSPAQAPPTPDLVPTLEDRAGQLAGLGYTGRAAQWLALVGLHTGVFTRSQWCCFFDHANREAARVEDERAIFRPPAHRQEARHPHRGRAGDLSRRRARRPPHRQAPLSAHARLAFPTYATVGRQGCEPPEIRQVLMRRLLSLDYLIERPSGVGLAPHRVATDKVQSAGGARHRPGHLAVPEIWRGRKGPAALLCAETADRQD